MPIQSLPHVQGELTPIGQQASGVLLTASSDLVLHNAGEIRLLLLTASAAGQMAAEKSHPRALWA
jgi:hypothetical protein